MYYMNLAMCIIALPFCIAYHRGDSSSTSSATTGLGGDVSADASSGSIVNRMRPPPRPLAPLDAAVLRGDLTSLLLRLGRLGEAEAVIRECCLYRYTFMGWWRLLRSLLIRTSSSI